MRLQIKVKPKSKIAKLEKLPIGKHSYLAKVKVPPEKGKANLGVIKLIADYFSVRKNKVRIIKGLKSSMKIVEVEN